MASSDKELDSLLGRVFAPRLRPGFADRVLHAVQPLDAAQNKLEESNSLTRGRVSWIGVAAVASLFLGLLIWEGSTSNARLQLGSSFSRTKASEEELLLRALTSLENTSGDLALVAQLGEVLEAELIERSSWLRKE